MNLLQENKSNDEVFVDQEMLEMTRAVFEIMKYIKERRFNKSQNNEVPSDK